MTLLKDEQSTGAVPFARVLAGVDGSDAGLQAAFQAGRLVGPEGTRSFWRGLASRARASWRRRSRACRIAAPQIEIVDGSAVDVLVDASASADLVIVGSRGLHGLSALGSVSERLAHKAHFSVLAASREPHPHDARTTR
jgi:hypothetical protein